MRCGDRGGVADCLGGVCVWGLRAEVCAIDLGFCGLLAMLGSWKGVGMHIQHGILDSLGGDEAVACEVLDECCIGGAGGHPGHGFWLLWGKGAVRAGQTQR